MKTRIAVIIALLLGSASVALATDSDDRFDVNIYRPAIQYSPLDAFAHTQAGTWGKGSVKSLSHKEQLWLNSKGRPKQ